MALAKTMMAWTMMSDGIPMIYQGQEQHFNGNATPFNREALWTSDYNTNSPLYQLAGTLNKIRKAAIATNPDYMTYVTDVIYSDDTTIVMRKGFEGRQVVTVLSSLGENGTNYNLMLPTAYESGLTVTDVLSCSNYTVDQTGQLNLPMNKGEPLVLFPADRMNGSQLCGIGNWSSTAETPTKGSSSEATRSNVYSSVAMIAAAVMAFCLF